MCRVALVERTGTAFANQSAVWEHLFVTSQGPPYARFRRALDSRNATVAFATATELDFVSLPDALEPVLLVVDDPRRFRRAALRWHARYCGEVEDVGFEERTPCSRAWPSLAGSTNEGRRGRSRGTLWPTRLERASEALTRLGTLT